MELAALFRQQSKKDIKSAYVLYKKYDYGNAAFLTQQALEKAIKYFMMKFNLADQCPESLRELTHKPEIEVINMLEERNNKFTPNNDVEKQYKQTVSSLLPDLRNIFKASDTSIVPYKTWWKISLGIKLTSDEEENAQTRIGKDLLRSITQAQKIKNKAIKDNDGKNDLISHMLSNAHDDFKTSQDALGDLSVKLPDVDYRKIQTALKNPASNLSSIIPKNYNEQNKKTVGLLKIVTWIMLHHLSLLQIAPHLELGRYPEEISNGVSSSSLYEENAEQLYILIKEVDKGIKELYAMVPS